MDADIKDIILSKYDEETSAYKINLAIAEAVAYILDFCNLSELPKDFNPFIIANLAIFALENEDIDIGNVRMGDVALAFNKQKALSSIDNSLIKYRRISW